MVLYAVRVVLDSALRLLHPFVSFVSEEIYDKLPERKKALIVSAYPEYTPDRDDPELAARFSVLQELVQAVRTVRSEFTLPPAKKIKIRFRCDAGLKDFLEGEKALIASLIKADDIGYLEKGSGAGGTVTAVGKGFEVFVFVRDAIDVGKEIERMKKTLEKTVQLKEQTEKKLSAENFVSRAPEEVIRKEREKLVEFSGTIDKIAAYLKELE